jgi:tetratricopeptide (TPR) repeat protein
MTLDEFVSKAMADHTDDAEGVFARLPEGVALVTESTHLPGLAHAIAHVSGEHLARWAEGLALLEALERLPVFDAASPAGKAVLRQRAVLHRCAGDIDASERCLAASATGGDVPEASDRVRVLAIASSAFAFQKRLDEARRDFEEAVALAAYGPTKADPASRALGVTGHNIAVEFENRTTLTDDERALMLRCAFVSRDFWRIAGGPTEAGLAEYRLAMSHLKAGDAATALTHANEYLRIAGENGSEPGDVFFAHEAIARSHLAAGDVAAARAERALMNDVLPTIADESFRTYCAGELKKLDAALPRERAPREAPAALRSPWK